MRHFEEAVIRLHQQGRFVSHYHVYIGQEATGAAVLEALGDRDYICTTHRNHGHIVGRGCDPNRPWRNSRACHRDQRRAQRHAARFGFLARLFIDLRGGWRCAGLATGAHSASK